MRTYPSSSCSSSSSSYSLASTRLETIFRKAYERSILCDVEGCVIYFGPDGELKTWPEDRDKVRDLALRYSQLNEAVRRKKSVNLHEFRNKKKIKDLKNLNKKRKTRKTSPKKVNGLKYPISDHYSPDQISLLIQSLEKNISTLQERRRFVESQKHKETKLEHQSSTPSSLNHHHQDHQHQTQLLNPSQYYSLFMYNNEDATLSQIPLSSSNINYNQDLSLLQESGLNDQNMSMGNISGTDYHPPFVSNTEHYSVVQESASSCGLDQLTQHEFYGFDQNMCMGEITNINVLDSYGGNMFGNTSFSQDLSDMYSSCVFNFDESSLVQTSSLPSRTTRAFSDNELSRECEALGFIC